MELWSVVVAGGSGTRYGGLKQLDVLAGRRVLDWSVDAVGSAAGSTGVVVVLPEAEMARTDVPGDLVVAGGTTRSESVRRGLAALPPSATHVLVHDAARPLATSALVQRVIAALATADAVVPVVPVSDTLRTVDGRPVDRNDFVAVQTPQGFELTTIRRAHDSGRDATDDATLVDALGGRVVHVEGESQNIKITETTDLGVAEALFAVSARTTGGSR